MERDYSQIEKNWKKTNGTQIEHSMALKKQLLEIISNSIEEVYIIFQQVVTGNSRTLEEKLARISNVTQLLQQ